MTGYQHASNALRFGILQIFRPAGMATPWSKIRESPLSWPLRSAPVGIAQLGLLFNLGRVAWNVCCSHCWSEKHRILAMIGDVRHSKCLLRLGREPRGFLDRLST